MGKTEITIFIILANLIILIFISGIIIFILQYRKRKLEYEKEKVRIEEQHRLDMLNSHIVIQQQTMQFIGGEIHDSVAQKLTLASIYSQKLEFENKYPGIADKINAISEIINDSLAELRDLSKTLTDNRIQQTSLTDLLRQECERLNDAGVCKATFVSDFGNEMSVTVKSFLLRVLQEFIQNSLKHAACNQINIRIEANNDGLSVVASDDGKGFDSSNIHSKGIGLNNMSRRIRLIGGNFNLESKPGEGTVLRVFIPGQNLVLS
jgi:signal transduction histidine kinase